MPKILTDYIRKNGLQALEDKYHILIKRHQTYNNLVLLKYSQIESPLGKEIVQFCRGIILDEDNDWAIVNYSYKKFFNHGMVEASDIDWSTARTYDKADGSLIQMYFYDGKWQVATSGVPDASGEVNITSTTFAELFWKTWNELGYELPFDKTLCCYSFELMTPLNRVVCRHKESKIKLHGAREIETLKELNPIVIAHQNGWECVDTYPLQTWDDIIEASKNLDPMEKEGYVVCDGDYNRVKLKSTQYTAISHLKDGFSTRRMLDIVRSNESREFLNYFEEYTELYHQVNAKYENLVGRIEGFYDAVKHIDDRKAFALIAKEQKFSYVLFGLKFGDIKSVKEALFDIKIKLLEDWLDVKSIKL